MKAKRVIIAATLAGLVMIVFAEARRIPEPVPFQEAPEPTVTAAPAVDSDLVEAEPLAAFAFPMDRALERVTKKPFGLHVTKVGSPVQPERFSGYHVGVDFETFELEQGIDVAIFAICDGPLLMKRRAAGYGGLAVQKCRLEDRDITVIYGHLDLASVTVNVGREIARGAKLGSLGEGYSSETDDERKHLHLGIHKGAAVDIRGYVQRKADLADWIDAREHLRS